MKKFLLTFGLFLTFVGASFASSYKVDDAAIDNMMANADDVTLVAADQALAVSAQTAGIKATTAGGAQTVGGFLVRSWFCGFIALHRTYMGTGGKTLWWMYFCIPVVGGITNCVDFWWVVFKGSEAMEKYRDNPKFIVWMD